MYYFKVPDKCQNYVNGIESFYACFQRRYNACPTLYPGSLRDACKEAFSSKIIEEVRSSLLLSHKRLFPFSTVQYSSTYIMTKASLATCFVQIYSATRLLLNIYLKIILSGPGISHSNQIEIGKRFMIR